MASVGEPQVASSVSFERETAEHDDGLSVFVRVRPRLFAVAYQMVGGATQAEDVLQEVWVRWQCTDRGVVENPTAFLTTTTIRLCINLLRSTRSRREIYFETSLPDPVDTTSCDPERVVERSEALTSAVLEILEKLSRTERAAYILREAFDYSYREIANLLEMEEANTRQLVSRARKHIFENRRRCVGSGEHRRFLEVFLSAARGGDMSALEGLLTQDGISSSVEGAVIPCPVTNSWPSGWGEVGPSLSA